MTLLEHVARAGAPVSLSDLSRAVPLPKPTAHRLARLLDGAALLRKDLLTRRYTVGPRLVDLGFHVIGVGGGRSHRGLLLTRLSEKLGETVNLGVLSGHEIVYLDRVEAAWPLRMDFKPGSRVPLHSTANGKLLLALAPAATRRRLLRTVRLTSSTPKTITSRARLRQELVEIARRGWSEDDEEFLVGVCCLAVPVRDHGGRVVAGLAVSAPAARFDLERARGHLPDLREAAAAIGAELDIERGGAPG